MAFPAVCVAGQGLALRQRLAHRQHVSVTALAVMSHLGIALNLRTLLAGVAHALASVWTLLQLGHAPLSASFLHQLLNGAKALARNVTDSLANMTTSKREPARLSTVRRLRVAVALACFFATNAFLDRRLQARRAVAQMAL